MLLSFSAVSFSYVFNYLHFGMCWYFQLHILTSARQLVHSAEGQIRPLVHSAEGQIRPPVHSAEGQLRPLVHSAEGQIRPLVHAAGGQILASDGTQLITIDPAQLVTHQFQQPPQSMLMEISQAPEQTR